MGLENINASSLRAAISQCTNALDYNNESQILSAISNESTWKCSAKNTLTEGMKDLINEFEQLKADLNKCNALANYAEKYQKYKEENENLSRRSTLAINKRASMKDKDIKERPAEYANYTKTIDYCLKRINSNTKNMESLESQANSIL